MIASEEQARAFVAELAAGLGSPDAMTRLDRYAALLLAENQR